MALPTTHFILDNTRLKEGLPKSCMCFFLRCLKDKFDNLGPVYLPEQNRWVPLQDVIGFVRIVP